MNRVTKALVFIGASFSLTTTALSDPAQDGYRPQTRSARPVRASGTFRSKRTAQRKPASDYSIRADQDVPRASAREWTLQLGLLGGYAYASTNNATEQAQRSDAGFSRNVYVGGVADFRVKRYAGAEIEGFYSIAPSQSVIVRDRVVGTQETDSKSLQQYGGMAHLKGQLPFRVGRVRVEPMLGAGFGTVGLRSASTNAQTDVEKDRNVQLWGFYGILGVEIEPVRRVVLHADYARSLATSGSAVDTVSNADASSRTEFTSARFERVRAGAYYRFTDLFMAGGQFIGRRVTYLAPGETTSTEENFNQFLGLVMIGF